MGIAQNLHKVKDTLQEGVQLVAVSKTKSTEEILEAYDAGQRVFGENKILEMRDKHQELPKDIEWHMIGHIQTNKVKYMAPFVALVHGVDRLKVLKELNKQAAKVGRVIPCLLQVHIANEETKFGFEADELAQVIEQLESYPNVEVKGLMGMATFTQDQAQIEQEFKHLHGLYENWAARMGWDTLSMGMSGDYPLAIACGSNMVRVGSAIFGARNY